MRVLDNDDNNGIKDATATLRPPRNAANDDRDAPQPWLALFFSRIAGTLIVTEVSSSWQGKNKNACAGQFLAVKPTLGVDFVDVVTSTTHANVRLRR
jgi:hypothetical protein